MVWELSREEGACGQVNQVPAEESRLGADRELTGKATSDRGLVRLRELRGQGGRILHKARKAIAEGGRLRIGGETRRKGRQKKELGRGGFSKEEEEGTSPKGTLLSGKVARGEKHRWTSRNQDLF